MKDEMKTGRMTYPVSARGELATFFSSFILPPSSFQQEEIVAMDDLRTRTKQFALRVIRLYGALATTTIAQVLGKQLLRSGTSVEAHYREGSRSPSNAKLVHQQT